MIKLKVLLCFLIFINILNANVILTEEEKNYIKNNAPIKLHNEKNWPPYNFYENGEAKGFSIDYMRLLSKKVGMPIEFISGYSWDEYMSMLQKNEIDSIINISKNKERSKIFNFTDIFHTAANAIYVQNGKEKLNSLEALKGKTIVMPKGFFAQQLIEKYYPDIKQILVKDSLECLKALSLGKADATIGKKNVLDYIISTNNISGVKAVNFVDDNRLVSLIRMATNKENTVLRDILQKGQKAISDEELLALKRKWFGVSTFENNKISNNVSFLSKVQRNYLSKNNVINVCSFREIKPIEFKENDKFSGVTIDLLELISKKLNVKMNYIDTVSLDKTKEMVASNECDIVPTYYRGIEFIEVANLSKPLFKQSLAIVTKKGEPIVKSLDELSRKSIAISKNSSVIKMINSNYPNMNIIPTNSNYESLEAVNSGKAYFALEPLPIALFYMSKFALNDIYISRYSSLNFSSNLAINDNKKTLLGIINTTIDNISENEHTAIFNKWTNVSIKEGIDKDLIVKITLGLIVIFIALMYRQIILHKHNKKLTEAKEEVEKKTLELAKQKELFETLYYKSSDAVLLIKNGVIIDCNESTENILRYSKNDILGTLLSNMCLYSQGYISSKLELAKNEKNITFEWLSKDKKGDSNWLEVVFTSIEIDNEPVIHAVFRDINKRKTLENEIEKLNSNLESKVEEEIQKNKEKTSQLIHQSRLAQMGEMLSMIAHQWRQPLTAITATSNNIILKNMIDGVDSKELNKELNLITDYTQHLSSTINDFRNFFKADKEKNTTTLEELIEKSLNIINTSTDANQIEIIKDYSCGKLITTYSNEIQQVILNILKNAEDVLLERNVQEKKIFINTYDDNKYAILEINDNSGGIKKEIMDKIFDPYFSTKKNQEGTGLGLYMSKTIINEHCNGKLLVHNNELGAVFTIKLELDLENE